MYRRAESKYGNRATAYNAVVYASKREALYAMELDMRVRAHDIKGWQRQYKLHLVVNGHQICTYIIDFVVDENDGTRTYVEVKGYKTPAWKLKWKLAEALLPFIDPKGRLLLVA